MLATEPLDLGPVRRLRRVDAAGTDDRLPDESGDLGTARLEQGTETLGVVRPDVDDLLDDLAAVASLVARDPGQRRAPGVHAVVAVLARHDDALLGPTEHVPVAPRELGRRVDPIRTARAEEDDGIIDRGERGEPLGQGDRGLRRVGTERRIRRQPLELFRHGIGDLVPPEPDGAVPERRGRIEEAPAVDRLEPDAFSGPEDDLRVLDRVHVGEAVPEPGLHH